MQKVFDSMGKGGMNFQDMSNMPNISMINLWRSVWHHDSVRNRRCKKKKHKEDEPKNDI